MDVQIIGRILKLQISRCMGLQLLCGLIGFIFAFFVVFLVMVVVKPDTYINMGAFIMCCVFFGSSLVIGIRSFTSDFIHSVKMGTGRKSYLLGTAIYYMVISFVFAGIIFISTRFETMMSKMLYGGFANRELVFESVLRDKISLLIMIGILTLVVCLIAGAVILKAGIRGFYIMYAVIMACFALVPSRINQIMHEMQNNSVWVMIIHTNFAVKILIAGVAVSILVGCSTMIYLREDIA